MLRIRNYGSRSVTTAIMALLLSIGLLVQGTATAGAKTASPLDKKRFGSAVDLGVQTYTISINDAVVGKEDGRDTMYTTVTSNNAIFNVIDIKKNELLRSFPMQGVAQSWRHAIAPDGTVYIAAITGSNTAELWSYSPSSKSVQKLGVIPGEKSPWSMTTDPDGNVYVGTFQTGKVFKYDPIVKTFHDYGQMVPGQEYVRSMAYYKGFIYAGIGSVGNVIKLNVVTGEKTKISDEVPALLGVEAKDVSFAYDMAVVDGWLFVKFNAPQMRLLFYDLENEHWSDKSVGKNSPSDAGVFSFNQLESLDGKVYVVNNRMLYEIDTQTLESRSTGIVFGTSLRGAAWIEFDNDPDFPGKSLVTIQSGGRITIFNVKSGKVKALPPVVQGAPNPLHNLEQGPDGNLYISGYPGGTGAKFDPRNRTTTRFTLGQSEGMVGLGDKMYFGVYPGGTIYETNVNKPEPVVSPVFTIGDDQDRPYVMKAAEGKLWIGTIPDYGKLGGGLTIYDPVTKEKKVYTDIVHNQSIAGIAYRDGKVYGSTTVYGGLGIGVTEKKAKMFVWDVAGERKTAEFELNLPGLNNPPMISGLTFGRDGLLWGAVDGYVFAMNPDSLKVVKSKNIYPAVKDYGFWRPIYTRWGEDGLLYVNVANKITVVDPDTMEHVSLGEYGEEVSFMTLANDENGNENIYYIGAYDSTRLKMIPILEGNRRVVSVKNGNFEEAVKDGVVRDWTQTYGEGIFSWSEEKSSDGRGSIKVTDNSQNGTGSSGGYLSDPISAESGAFYKAEAKLYVESGSTDDSGLLIHFYNADGKEIGRTVSAPLKGVPQNEWLTVQASALAPEGTDSLRIQLYTSAWNLMTAYYDDVRLSETFAK